MNVKIFKIIVAIFLLLGSIHLRAQSKTQVTEKYTYKRYTLADGLPQMQVTHITQDHNGYLWVSHWNGLSRFNGFDFENFTQDEGLLDIAAFCALEYMPDSIAVISFKGISIGNVNGFRSYLFPKSIQGDRNAYIYFIDDKLFLTNLIDANTQRRKSYCFDLNNYQFRELKSLQNYFIREVRILSKSFQVYTDDCYFEYEKKNNNFLKKRKWDNVYEDFAKSPLGDYFAYNKEKQTLFKIEVDSQGLKEVDTKIRIKDLNDTYRFNRFVITTDNKVVWYDNNYELYLTDTEKTQSVGKRFGLIRNFFSDREGNLWVATEEGLYNYLKFQFQTTKLFSGDLSDMIWSIAQDKNGDLLFASANKGLWRKKGNVAYKVNMEKYKKTNELNIDLDRAYMGAISTKKGSSLIPFKNSLFVWKDAENSYQIPTEGNIEMLINSNYSDTIYGAITGGIFKIAPDGKVAKVTSGFAKYQNESIAEDKYGRFWLGSTRNNTIQIYENNKLTYWQDSLINSVISLSTDVYKNIWIGNHEGIFLYDYKSVRKIAPSIIKTPIYNIIPYNDSIMVLGSGQQLFTINLSDLYDKNEETLSRNSPNSGFTAEECVQNSYCSTNDNALIIPATNFCYTFYPEDFSSISTPPPPYIESIQFAPKDLNWETINEKNQPDKFDRNLAFSFISIFFSEQDYLQYRYRLLGYQKEWSFPTEERIVRYNNLKYGEYKFEVQASVDGINWSKSSFSNEIILPRQFSETWFFRVLSILVFGSIIFFLTRKYFNDRREKALEKQKQLEQISNLQLVNIKSQLNPHFIFNVMNHMGASIIKNEREDAYDYFVKLSQLIRESLKESDKSVKTLEAELLFIQKYLQLQKYRFGERLQFSIEIDKNIDRQLLIPRMCLQILVENAIKHGLESLGKIGELKVFGKVNKEGIVLGVSDNGKGFSKNEGTKGDGKGLSSLRKMLAIYNTYNTSKATLRIISDGNGSKVMIYIPKDYTFSLNK